MKDSNSTTLTSNARALLGLQEVMRCYGLDVKALGIVSMLSVRAHQLAQNGKYWCWALRKMFPEHAFQAIDRELQVPPSGPRFLSSRNARISSDADADRSIPAWRRNEFSVCLDLGHAEELLRFALLQSGLQPSKGHGQGMVPCQIVTPFKPLLRERKRVEECTRSDMPNVVSQSVVVNLYRPQEFCTHTVSIDNGRGRSHSNLPCKFDPKISHLCDAKALTPAIPRWCPRDPPNQSEGGADSVVIQCWDPRSRKASQPTWYLEGVGVQARGPVAIRVDLQVSSRRWAEAGAQAFQLRWIPAAGGVVLRPFRRAHVRFECNVKPQPVELFALPEPHEGSLLYSVRVTVVECDGSPVRVGLLASQVPSGSRSVYADRIERFEAPDAYREWWYRLQRIRSRVRGAMSVLRRTDAQVASAMKRFQATFRHATRLEDDSCLEDPWWLPASAILYALAIFLAFPAMLALNLDQLAAEGPGANGSAVPGNGSLAPAYSIAHPDPQRIMRTTCWQRGVDPGATPRVPWLAVFCPLMLVIAYAGAMLVARVSVRFASQMRAHHAFAEHRSADLHLALVHKEAEACNGALLEGDDRADPIATNIIDGVVAQLAEQQYESVRNRPIFSKHHQRQFLSPQNLFDAVMMFVAAFGVVAYAVADWCLGSIASEGSAALPITLVTLCVGMDSAIGLFLRALARSGRMPKFCACTSVTMFGILLLQQLLLLLEVFTVFHKVSFALVFAPMVLATVVLGSYVMTLGALKGIMAVTLGVAAVTSTVLLMLKTDRLFGVGTALLFRSSFPEFSWLIVMVPMWVAAALMSFCFLLYKVYRFLCYW